MAKKKGDGSIPIEGALSAGEARVMEAARRAYRLAQEKLHDARDPASSKAAYESVWAASDEVGRAIVESIEGDEAEEEPESFVDEHGAKWKAVTEDDCAYHTLRGTIRVQRKRHRSVRNGPTRCLFEERRGVMARNTMPDLGEAMLRTYADVPGDESAKLLTALTGHAVSPSRIKRFVTEEATRMHTQEQAFFDTELAAPDVPSEASTLVISVDALSLHLREEGWKQATVGVLTLLDAEGEPLRRGAGVDAIRIAEMPEAGKQTIMARIEREVGALVAQRPDLEIEVVIDGAPDLRTHLLERFPEARHLTDFFHVAEHLAAALRLLFPDASRRLARPRTHAPGPRSASARAAQMTRAAAQAPAPSRQDACTWSSSTSSTPTPRSRAGKPGMLAAARPTPSPSSPSKV